MKVYELIKVSESLLSRFDKANISVGDSRYIPMYEDYNRLTKECHKQAYIIAYLSDIYKYSERHIYRVIDRFEKDI